MLYVAIAVLMRCVPKEKKDEEEKKGCRKRFQVVKKWGRSAVETPIALRFILETYLEISICVLI